MRYYLTFSMIALLLFYSCNSSKKEALETHSYTNQLIHETSPYLLQHAHNPVNWRAWNDETLKLAKDENKLMVISIGYAACHWCHVMEEESFEDSIVASTMNKNFISVKVDREERPDVDQIYINAVQLMTGSAGWPLNVITLPDGRPVWGGTYFKKENWIQALERVLEIYQSEPQKLIDYADRLEEGLKSMDLFTLNTDEVDYSKFNISEIIEKWSFSFDSINGGYKRAPKFMLPNNYHFLLRYAFQNNNTALMEYVELTLRKIAYGGVYDHIGGGFSRYSVDTLWHVPHFEKMLYDNAQLVSLYSDAYLIKQEPLYKDVVMETLDFISLNMTSSKGAFYSSLDADSKTSSGELKEGAYYSFTEEELQYILMDDFDLFKEYYNINEYGKWEEDLYVLIRNERDEDFLNRFDLEMEVFQEKKQKWKNLLSDYRNKRPKPRIDDKILTSWNGLMLKAYVDAYRVFQRTEYLTAAERNAKFISTNLLMENGALFHNHKDGKSTINGYLEDYASVIDAYISLYEVTMEEHWIELARKMTDYTFAHFFDVNKHMFYFTSDEDTKLVTRSIEYRDNVLPASNSIMAKNLFKLSHYFDVPKYSETSHQMLKNVQAELEEYPSGFSNWLDLLLNHQSKYFEVVVVGKEASRLIQELNHQYIPNKLVAGSESDSESYLLKGRYVDDKTYIYVCVNNTCKLPVTDARSAIDIIHNY